METKKSEICDGFVICHGLAKHDQRTWRNEILFSKYRTKLIRLPPTLKAFEQAIQRAHFTTFTTNLPAPESNLS